MSWVRSPLPAPSFYFPDTAVETKYLSRKAVPMSQSKTTAGAILAGGLGSRLGGDKAMILLAGKPLVSYAASALATCDPICIVGDEKAATELGIINVADVTNVAHGPLRGVLAALVWAQSLGASYLVTLPCDMPFLPFDIAPRLVEALQSAESVVACGASEAGLEPLVAAWQVEAMLVHLRAALRQANHPPVNRLLRGLNAASVHLTAHEATNINTPQALQAGEDFLAS
jgi:molybdenum cofactor guanylyltransferase